MKQQICIGIGSSLLLSGGFLASARAAVANPQPSNDFADSLSAKSKNLTLVAGVPLPENQKENPTATPSTPANLSRVRNVANIRSYQQFGREAATVYVRSIPIVTFLGSQTTPAANSPTAPNGKVPAPNVTLPTAPTPNNFNPSNVIPPANALAASSPNSPGVLATALANQLNQLYQENFDANQIRVIWNPSIRNYAIQANQTNLLTLNDTTIAPEPVRNRSLNALRITNLLRRQLGNAPALTAIEGPAAPAVTARGIIEPKPPIPNTPTSPSAPSDPSDVSVRYQFNGHASWYGPGFHGRRTANGERFNQYAMTAAHKSLPFGTRMRVTNLVNGRSVIVRINDRGPFIPGRVLDLSQGAAQEIGIISSGTGNVKMEVLR
jgi:rare lipoprotein A